MPIRDNDMIPDHWPDHEFKPHRAHPDLCVAPLDTATEKEHGHHMFVQCGHHRDAHPVPEEAM